MAATIILPVPLISGSIAVGQLLSDPLNPASDSYFNPHDSLPLKAPSVLAPYKNTLAQDDNGHLTGRVHERQLFSNMDPILVDAEEMTYTALRDPLAAFRYISRRASSQTFLHKMALRRQPLYLVTAIREVTNPTFTGSLHDTSLPSKQEQNEFILSVELRKVTCRIASPEDAQHPADVGYAFKHYKLQGEEDMQLAVGLGGSLTPAEFRLLSVTASDSDFTDDSANSSDFDDDEDGVCCASCGVSNAAYRRY